MYTHIYTHKQNQNSPKKKKAEIIDPVSKGKQKWYHPVKN